MRCTANITGVGHISDPSSFRQYLLLALSARPILQLDMATDSQQHQQHNYGEPAGLLDDPVQWVLDNKLSVSYANPSSDA